ncbi:hypothetical protein LX36DRAFT_329807 [Colletotrichum falcatum]|nr:hypothetical protein LX36DRAFT_329807 [Colletotrichum falcatum]
MRLIPRQLVNVEVWLSLMHSGQGSRHTHVSCRALQDWRPTVAEPGTSVLQCLGRRPLRGGAEGDRGPGNRLRAAHLPGGGDGAAKCCWDCPPAARAAMPFFSVSRTGTNVSRHGEDCSPEDAAPPPTEPARPSSLVSSGAWQLPWLTA